MKAIRNFFAVMLMGLAFAAFQSDADAQSRRGGETRSTNSSDRGRSTSSVQTRPSSTSGRSSAVQSRSSSSQSRQSSAVQNRSSSQSRQSSAVQSRPSSTSGRSSAVQSRPSSSQNRQSSTVQNRPASQKNTPSRTVRPSADRQVSPQAPAPAVNRPSKNTASVKPDAAPSRAVKPSNTVRQPAKSPVVNRPANSQRPSQRPGAGTAFKPDKHRPPVQIRPNHRHDKPRVHPIHRDFIAYDRPSSYWSAHHHYFGHRVRVLPARARIHRYRGIAYYCYNDIWYRPYGGYYVICRPPFGTVLAANIVRDITWTAVRMSYYNTVYNTFRQINENNEYIAQQNAIIAQNNATIAAQNQTIAMNQAQANAAYTLANDLGLIQSYAAADSEYFYQDGVFYAKAANGEYSVIVPPAGALVETLPEDYDMVTLKGEEYYKVDDTVYKVTLSDGKPYFEVLGQLYS